MPLTKITVTIDERNIPVLEKGVELCCKHPEVKLSLHKNEDGTYSIEVESHRGALAKQYEDGAVNRFKGEEDAV